MPSSTLLHLTLGALVVSVLPSCGPGEPSVLVAVSNLSNRTTQLAVSATLDQKPLMSAAPATVPVMAPLDSYQLGLTVPMAGHLAFNLQAFDSDQCLQGTASAELDVIPGLNNGTAAIAAQSPRKCGNLAPCNPGAACSATGIPAGTVTVSIWTTSPTDIWAVGTSASMLHYDGTSWTVTPTASLPVPSTTQFNGVWASASNDVWVVGTAGRIIHFDGTKWSLSTSNAPRDLTAISGLSSKSIWAVGLAASSTTPGEFLHWSGSQWDALTPPTSGDLTAVVAVNPNFVIGAGGNNGSGVLWVWDGISKFKDYSSSAPVTLYGLWASDPTHAIAVGAVGEILIFDGTSWKLSSNSINNYLYAVTSDGTNSYVVGDGGFAMRSSDPALATLTPVTKVSGAVNLFTVQRASNGLVWLGGSIGLLGYTDSHP